MLKFEHIDFSYGENPVLKDFGFTANEGEATAVLGPSGFGKTTLLGLASGLLSPKSGVITPFDAQKPSFVFQEDRLLPWCSAKENLSTVGISDAKAEEYLEKLGLGEAKGKLPKELSGGMCRRLAIARALAFSGDCFYFDEPLRGLDIKTGEGVLNLIKSEIIGKTALIITHSPKEAFALCERIVLVGESPLRVLADVRKSDFESSEELEAFIRNLI